MTLRVEPFNSVATVEATWPPGRAAPGRAIEAYRWEVRALDGSWSGTGHERSQALSLFAPQTRVAQEGSLCVASVQDDGRLSKPQCETFTLPEIRPGPPPPAEVSRGVAETRAWNARPRGLARSGSARTGRSVYCAAAGGTTTTRGACEAIEKSLGWPELPSYSTDWGLGWRFDNRSGGLPDMREPDCAELGGGDTNLGLSCRPVDAGGAGASGPP